MNRTKPLATLFAAMLMTMLSGCSTIQPGHLGVQVYFGELQTEVLDPGMYWRPLTSVYPMSLQVQATEASSSATTNDLQNVTTLVTLNWSRNSAEVRTQYERYPDIEGRIIAPAIQESVKSITAQNTATDLVQKRQRVKQAIIDLIDARLAPLGIVMDTVNITDFAFSDEFNIAIEAKVKAEQEALRAVEELAKTKVVAQQDEEKSRGEKAALILAAEGRAQAIMTEGAALRQNPQVMELRRIEAWNGVMPTTLVSDGAGTLLGVAPGMR